MEISHPEKVMFPTDGITKGELAGYYESVASIMLPHVRARPITMERFHRGIGEKGFFQKNLAKPPRFVDTVAVPKKDGVVNYPTINDAQGVVWMANQNSITPHVWTSRAPDLMHPDLAVFDLDPADDDLDRLRRAALLVRSVLSELGCDSWVKTSGSKGFHIAVPLDRSADYGEVARFGHAVGRELVQRDPENFTQEFYKADRGGRILIEHRPERIRGDVCGAVCGSAPCGCTDLSTVHLGRGSGRDPVAERGRPSFNGRATGQIWRHLGRDLRARSASSKDRGIGYSKILRWAMVRARIRLEH